MPAKTLKWEVDNGYTIAADSQINDEGSPFTWRIVTVDENEYSIASSTPELISNVIFAMLDHSTIAKAKKFCQKLEDEAVASAEWEE